MINYLCIKDQWIWCLWVQ